MGSGGWRYPSPLHIRRVLPLDPYAAETSVAFEFVLQSELSLVDFLRVTTPDGVEWPSESVLFEAPALDTERFPSAPTAVNWLHTSRKQEQTPSEFVFSCLDL